MPVLGDLHKVLLAQEEREAKHIATALEIYVSGSLNVFNHRTNVDIRNRLSATTSRNWASSSKAGMLIVQDQVWNASPSTAPRGRQRATTWMSSTFF
jgi:hypothetical protein